MAERRNLKSFSELPDSRFSTYEEFVEAQKKGEALVWVRFSLKAIWKYGTKDDRNMATCSVCAGLYLSLILAFIALIMRDSHLLIGIVPLLLAFFCATPAPSCAHGCLPMVASIIVLGASLPFHKAGVSSPFNSLFLGFSALLFPWVWILACGGMGVGDTRIREIMLESEQTFISLYNDYVITDVRRKEIEPEATDEGESAQADM